jgi:hypothetical protein
MGLGQTWARVWTCLDPLKPTQELTLGVAIFDRCQNEFQETMRQSGSH